jgi:HECT-like Ubiquitin-conjugating enzyme (E2)-binding
MVWYCSVVCQRNDWNRFGDRSPHREACRAWAELSKMVLSSSLSDATRGYHEANDEIEKIRQAQSRLPNKTPYRIPRAATSGPVFSADTTSWIISNVPKVSFHVEDTPNLRCYNIHVAIDLEHREEPPATSGDWSVQCATVGPDRTRFTIFNSNWPNVKLLQLLLPRLLAVAPSGSLVSPPQVHSISARSALVRVSYFSAVDSVNTNETGSYDFDFKPLAVDEANGLACRSCLQPLFSPAEELEPIIRRVSPLPSGRWNDMDDFLICYPGTAAVDFASTSTHGQPGCLWIDENILVCSSLDAATSLSVLPDVVGYGQSWAQGPHREGPISASSSEPTLSQAQDPALRGAAQIWQDSAPGETLCCSRCCSVLGWSCKSMEQTYRLLRHRLVLPNLDVAPVPKEEHQGASCIGFIAREMIRYAECQAIFTFVLILDSIDKGPVKSSSSNETQSAGGIPCVWLRLLSWDTIAANGTTPSSSNESDLTQNHSGELEWCQVAKVAFEDGLLSVDDMPSRRGVPIVDVFPNSFLQRGATDWCCPRTRSTGNVQAPAPSALQQAPAGSPSLNRDLNAEPAFGTVVHLHLETEEWIAARRALRHAGRWYSFEMVQATIMAQTGKEIYNIDNKQAGLAAIRLRD